MRRSFTKDYVYVASIQYYILHYAIYLQEECDSLINATFYGDMEVVSTLISDGVDMNAIIHEVCITTIVVVYLY